MQLRLSICLYVHASLAVLIANATTLQADEPSMVRHELERQPHAVGVGGEALESKKISELSIATPETTLQLPDAVTAQAEADKKTKSTIVTAEATIREIPANQHLSLGEHRFGMPVRAEIALINRFGKRLTIRNIDPDCGCLNVESNREDFEPGETLRLTLELASAKKLATIRRSIRILFLESNDPYVLHLDVRVVGPLRLTRNRIDIPSTGARVTIRGRKFESGLVLHRWQSVRGAFRIDGDLLQTEDTFQLVIRPTFSFGNASDLLRLDYCDSSGAPHLVDLPLEFHVSAPIRFLPSTVHLSRRNGRWVGRTRMVLSPRKDSVDLESVRFVALTENESVYEPTCLTVNAESVSRVLSMVSFSLVDLNDAEERRNRSEPTMRAGDPGSITGKDNSVDDAESENHEPVAVFPNRLTVRDATNNVLGILYLSRTED